MKKWRCRICGYIHTGTEPPEKCPVCGADKSKFEELPADAALSTEVSAPTAITVKEQFFDLVSKNHIHPILVHFPNGAVPIAVFCTLIFYPVYYLAEGPRLDIFYHASLINLVFVLLSMPVVAITGYVDWRKKYKGNRSWVFKTKIACGIITTVLCLALIAIKVVLINTTFDAPRVFLFGDIFLSVALLVTVVFAGHLGGKLVFEGHK